MTTAYTKENADADKHYHVCTVCGTKDAGEVHTWNVEAATEETDKHCTVCGYVAELKLTHTHSYDSGKVTKKATCTSNGTKTYTCTACGATKTETIKSAGHKVVKDKGNNA